MGGAALRGGDGQDSTTRSVHSVPDCWLSASASPFGQPILGSPKMNLGLSPFQPQPTAELAGDGADGLHVAAVPLAPDPSHGVLAGDHRPGVGQELRQHPIHHDRHRGRPTGKEHPALGLAGRPPDPGSAASTSRLLLMRRLAWLSRESRSPGGSLPWSGWSAFSNSSPPGGPGKTGGNGPVGANLLELALKLPPGYTTRSGLYPPSYSRVAILLSRNPWVRATRPLGLAATGIPDGSSFASARTANSQG